MLPEVGQLVNLFSDILESARHIEFEVVPSAQSRIVDEVSHCFCARGIKKPENFVPGIQVKYDFCLYLVFLKLLRYILPKVAS